MTNHPTGSLVTVYSTPLSFDAGLVKAMLAEQGIPCSVEDANGPFPKRPTWQSTRSSTWPNSA